MEHYISAGIKENLGKTRLNLFDKLVGRTKQRKLAELLHYKYCLMNGINNVKFNGRYPFCPLYNATEFFSALFSFGNFVSNILSYMYFISPLKELGLVLVLNKIGMYINLVTWASATTFHINDTIFTRNLDYFSSFLNILFFFYITQIRLFFMFFSPKRVVLSSHILIVFFGVIYFIHVYYMAFIEFNFSLNKSVCTALFVAAITQCLYIVYVYSKHKHSLYLLVFSLGFLFSGWVESLDLPPMFYLVDSHATFHLLTIIFTPFYYAFLKKDLTLNNWFLK